MKKFTLFLVALCFAGQIFAQRQFLENNRTYTKAKIYEKGMPALVVNNLILADTVLRYSTVSGSGSLGLTNIRYVGIKAGSHAASYGAYGAAVGLLSSLYGVLDVKADPTLDDSGVNWAPFIIGFTAGGALIGAIVGACVPKWKLLYIPDRKTSYSIVLAPVTTRNYNGMGLRITF